VSAETPPVSPATATLNVEVNPICAFDILPPTLAIASGYENPDTDGAFALGWTRPLGAIGPDVLQEASTCSAVLDDPADEPLVSGENATWTGTSQWSSQVNPTTGSLAYFVPAAMEQNETLVLNDAFFIPDGVSSTLTFTTRSQTEECCDSTNVQVSADGVAWTTVASYSGPGETPGDFFDGVRTIDLSDFAGQSIKIRFQMLTDQLLGGGGWYIQDIKVVNADWTDVGSLASPAFDINGHANGSFCYRVATTYPTVSAGTIASDWSNTIIAVVNVPVPPVAVLTAPASVNEGASVTLDGSGSSDGNGDVLEFSWAQTRGMDTHPVPLPAPGSTSKATFTAPAVCTNTPLGFKLTVSDGTSETTTGEVGVIIANINNPPSATAGQDFTASAGVSAMLSASGTTDLDCEPLDYSWVQVGGPDVALSGSTSAQAGFTVPADAPAGTHYTFRLTVSDDFAASSDDITVTVSEVTGEPEIGNANVGALSPAGTLALGLLGLLRLRRRKLH
jgi:hypothetical protein